MRLAFAHDGSSLVQPKGRFYLDCERESNLGKGLLSPTDRLASYYGTFARA